MSNYAIHTIEDFESHVVNPEALSGMKEKRDWLKDHGFSIAIIEWREEGLLALIVHPLDEAPKVELVHLAYKRAQLTGL